MLDKLQDRLCWRPCVAVKYCDSYQLVTKNEGKRVITYCAGDPVQPLEREQPYEPGGVVQRELPLGLARRFNRLVSP